MANKRVEYSYGSKPQGYDYLSFVKHIAPKLPRNDRVFCYESSLNWRNNRQCIPFGLFKNICHWKSPRRFKRNVLNNTKCEVNKRWQKALRHLNEKPFQDNAIRCALKELIQLNGVGVPTASALLTAWNPAEFGIIDFKVLNVLGLGKTISINSYVRFRNKLRKLRNDHPKLHNCALRKIELAIWHYYSIKDSSSRKRTGGC